MAAPDTNASDLDRANATIKELVSHLDNFKWACEQPSLDPSTYERLQQLRISSILEDVENIREPLDSVSNRLSSDVAEREKKQAILDRAIEAAEKSQERLDKKEERLDRAILYVRAEKLEAATKNAEAATKKAEAVVEKVEAEKRMADAEKMRADAVKKMADAEKMRADADKNMADAEKMRADADKKMADAEKMMQADQSIRESIDRLSDVSRELAEASAEMGRRGIATQGAKTSTSKLVADLDSTGKRPLSSGVEPTRKRARSVGPVLPTGRSLDKDPRANVSGGRFIIPLRSQSRTAVTSGPSGPAPGASGSAPGASGSSDEPSSSNDTADIYGLRPGFGICPARLRNADNEIQRTWAQIEFGDGWTMTESMALVEEFRKYAAKGVPRQTPQNTLDRCAEATGNNANCLLQNFRKLGSNWNANEDKSTKQCKECTKRDQLCIRVAWAGGIHGAYNRDATDVRRWNLTRRQL
ncbi:hypothetical protein BDR22DRAFT_817870 [Usnea florida]